ncbi:MAG: chemotaxis protein CheA, partial [Lachnospiraceae bacterium]|nr:chemotaxis protein CheA [Lachnospiraceae bacterium]
NLNTQILDLEQDSENMDTINEIFRAAHSLKGMAGTMGYKRMQTLTHDMENVFSEVRTGNIKVTAPMIDTLFQCLDALEEYLANIQESADEGENDNEPLIKELNRILNSKGQDNGDTQEPAEEKEKEESAANWETIELKPEDKQKLSAAAEAGKHVYGIKVSVQESCLLKAARAFLVFKAIEELGEVVATDPSTQDIEDEKFDFHFSLIVTTDKSLDEVTAAIKNVSEIAEAVGSDYQIKKDEKVQASEETAVVTAQESAPVVVEQPKQTKSETPAAAKQQEKKSSSKQQVNRTVRVDIEKLDVLMNLVSELIIAKNSLVSSATGSVGDGSTAFNEQIEYLESVTTNLHESVMKVRMVPIESVVNKFPRMIRDLSKKLNKQMELYMTGEETELDRTVVDEIGDPLMHLLRNSADHGLETTEERIARGKSPVGSIFLDAYQDGNNVVIEVRDDGNGIDAEKIREKAIERGFLTEEQALALDDEDVISLLFEPGFSTAKQVTDVSGRGVGLDVVKSKIESLSGEVEVKTKLGEGSTFIIRLPLTLAIIQALMVVVGGEKYAISLGGIQTIEDVDPRDVKTVQSKEVIHLRGTVIPLIRLEEVLDIESQRDPNENMVVVIVKKGDKLAGLVIDELIGQQEIVIKSMGKYINKCKFISGATILGDGEIALILDANALI